MNVRHPSTAARSGLLWSSPVNDIRFHRRILRRSCRFGTVGSFSLLAQFSGYHPGPPHRRVEQSWSSIRLISYRQCMTMAAPETVRDKIFTHSVPVSCRPFSKRPARRLTAVMVADVISGSHHHVSAIGASQEPFIIGALFHCLVDRHGPKRT